MAPGREPPRCPSVLGHCLTPNTTTNNMACNSVLGMLTGMAHGMTFQLPNATGLMPGGLLKVVVTKRNREAIKHVE